ncbi:MAG: single-stranded DNA-binding protein [Chloroflexota bacterium]
MASLCKISIIGRLGADPEMRYTPNGRPVTELRVAVNQSTRSASGEWTEATDWFRVSVWGDRAERVAEQLRKGSSVFVEGRFRTREYEAREGGKRISLEISADSVVNLDPRVRDEEGGGYPAARPAAGAPRTDRPAPPPAGDDFDDLPF